MGGAGRFRRAVRRVTQERRQQAQRGPLRHARDPIGRSDMPGDRFPQYGAALDRMRILIGMFRNPTTLTVSPVDNPTASSINLSTRRRRDLSLRRPAPCTTPLQT